MAAVSRLDSVRARGGNLLTTNHAYRETRVSTVTLNPEEQDWRRLTHHPTLISFNYEGTSLALPARGG